MASFTGKVAVRDSFDEDDISDDVDDEVFIRDGRNGFKVDEERGAKRPLMPPRRRLKPSKVLSSSCQHSGMRLRMFLAPCCYGLLALIVLLGLIALVVILLNVLPLSLNQLQFWKGRSSDKTIRKSVVPCSDFAVTDVWTKSFPKLTSETAVRLSDVNNDKVLDVIIGYGTGADGRNVPDFVCTLYFGRDPPCLGGIVALDGRTSDIVWQHWTQRPVFSVDCGADLTKDGVNDCLIGGKGGLLHAVNGHDGSLLWHIGDSLQEQESKPLLDVYSAQYIPDIDGDSFVDVIAAHTATNTEGTAVNGHLILVSGKAGRLLRRLEMPGVSESYYTPQLLVRPDGQEEILIGTGGTAGHSLGGIHIVPLSQLATSEKLQSSPIVTSDNRGVLAPPVLADINKDGVEDIIVALFNSTVVAIDGHSYLPLWNYSFPNSQTLSPPTPGYFNDDDVPDFLVKYQNGPDFPIYYFSQMNILDGKTGLPLLDRHVVDTVGSQMGGLSISIEGLGNDWFIFWTANCVGYEGSQSPFSFAKGSSIIAQSTADLCRLRFNSSMSATLWAINQKTKPPGVALYSSEWRETLEYNNSHDAHYEAYHYLLTHPDFWSIYGDQVKVSSGIGSPSKIEEVPSGNTDVSMAWSSSQLEAPDQLPRSFEGDTMKEMPSNTKNSLEASVSRMKAHPEITGSDGRGEVEELEEPGYSHLQPHHVGKSRGSWNLDLDEGRDSDVVDREYGDLAYLRNSGGEGREIASNFLQAIHDEASQEESMRKHSKKGGAARFDDLNLIMKPRRLRQLKSSDFSQSNVNYRDVENMSYTSGSKLPSGIYPITSTGTLAPPLSGTGIDLIILSYWIPPSEGVQILLPNDLLCIHDNLERATKDGSGKYSGMDDETLELAVTAECLLYRYSSPSSNPSFDPGSQMEPHPGFIPQSARGPGDTSNIYDSMNVRLGQLTVYRFNLQCKCRKINSQHETCAKILPFAKQGWPSHMGHDGKSYFHPKL